MKSSATKDRMGGIDVSKVNEALEELVVATANLYGGFEGFDDDENYNMMLARNKIMAWHEAELAAQTNNPKTDKERTI